jgi:NADPH:quinone reductase-like Zn-dependent oxidoreductase
MKAAVRSRYGSPDVITLQEVEAPVPNDDEVLIEVQATTVNRTDCGYLRGMPRVGRLAYGIRGPKHPILGNEFAGRIVAIGAEVGSYAVGDDVFGYNEATFGAHADYLAMPASGMMAVMPAGLSYTDAAPTAEGAHYALNILRKAHVGPGTRMMVYGATGAIGSAAVQLAKHMGAEVTAICGTDHMAFVQSLGPDRVIDYMKDDFTSGDQGTYNFVFDAVGKRTFGECKPMLKPGGIYCSSDVGPRWENVYLALWTMRFGEHKLIFPIPRTSREDMDYLKGLVESGAFRPVIDRTYPLDRIVEAFRYVETGMKVGNVVITVRDQQGT